MDLQLCCCAIYESLLRIIVKPSFLLRWTRLQRKQNTQIIEEAFYGNVSKNIIGACQQLVDGNHAFSILYNKNEGDDGNVICLKSSCCGEDTSSYYVAGRDFTAKMLETFSNGKAFQGRAIWKMADMVLESLKSFSCVAILSQNREYRLYVQSRWVC